MVAFTADRTDRLCTDGGTDDGLITLESDASVAETIDRFKDAVADIDGLSLMAEIDHTANAASVDRDLPQTTVLVFGNPDLGTPMMQAAPTLAIDLPSKLLVMEREERVTVSYNDPAYLVDRHDVEGMDDQIETIADALSSLAAVAAGQD